MPCDLWVFDINGTLYSVINEKVTKTFRKIFDLNLTMYLITDKKQLQKTINEQIKLIPPGKKHNKKLYEKLIKKERRRLESRIGEVNGENNKVYKYEWPGYILQDPVNLLYTLIFDVVREDFENFNLKFESFKEKAIISNWFAYLENDLNLLPLNKFFFTEKMKSIYLADAVIQNIEYLQKLILELKIIDEKKLSDGVINDKIELGKQLQEIKEPDSVSLLSSFENHLFDFKEKIKGSDYNNLIYALKTYFETGEFPKLEKIICVNRISKKEFGWSLNMIHQEQKGSLSKDYLRFAKENISLFNDAEFNEDDFRNCNLYKYFTNNVKKSK